MSSAGITVVPENQGFFRLSGIDNVSTAGSGWLTGTGSSYAMGYLYSNEGTSTPQTQSAANGYYSFNTRSNGDITPVPGTTRTDVFSLGMVVSGATNKYPKAGSTKLHVYATDDGDNKVELSTIILNVNGLNYNANEDVTTYFENGELVKNAIRTVGKDSYIFDENGIQVTGSKVVALESGSVLVLDGVLAKAGMRTLESKSYLIGENGKILSGWQDYENNTYYADPENNNELVDGLVTIAGKTYVFKSTVLQKNASAKDYAAVTIKGADGKDITYYTNKDGEAAMAGIFKVDEKDRLFREDGTIVTHTDADVVDGKIKVKNIGYIIADDDTAKRDDVLYNASVQWTVKYPSKVTKGLAAPELKYTVTYTSANTGETKTTEEIPVVAVPDGDFTATSKATEITFTATPDLSAYFVDKEGKTPATATPLTRKYKFKDGAEEGVAGEYTYKNHKFTWNDIIGTATEPVVTAVVNYTLTTDEGSTTETDTPLVVITTDKKDDKTTTFTAEITLMDGSKKSETKKYNNKTGKIVTSESGSTAGEADDSVSVNLFYTDVELSIPTGDWTTEGASGKWTSYYKVDDSGAVTVLESADRKKAATAANSLIVLPVKDSEGAVVGEFEYQLPVFYQKPSLKLTSASATIKTGAGDQTVSTIVTEKKSNGLYEAIDLSSQDTTATPFYGATTAETGDALGEIAITTATAVTGTKIAVKLDNWSEKVELKYTVKAVAKDVLTASAKQVVMNANVTEGEAQEVTIKLNNGDIDSDSGVAVTMPKKDPGVEIEGIEEGKLTSSTLTFKYKGDAAPTAGTYTYKFKAGSASASVKLVVNGKPLANAVTLGVKTKINLMTGQKMVVVPTLKGIGGPIEDVAFDSTSADLFEAEYNDEINQIIITPVDATKLNPKTKYQTTLTVKAGGVECPTALKIQLDKKKPGVKIAKVTIPAGKLSDGTGEGVSNILATYKVGTKTFAVAPTKVEFLDGKNVLTLDDEEYATSAKGIKVKYNGDGTISVKAVSGSKGGAVNVKVYFGTESVTKSLTVKKGKN